MRKQGLVHLHALCTLLREYLEDREDLGTDTLDGSQSTASPAAIHRPKAEHRRAVDALASRIATAVDPDGDGETADLHDGTGTTRESD
jgi:hypothetical protein